MANSENLDLKRLDEPKASTNFNHQIYYQNNFDKIDAAMGAPPSTLTTAAKTVVPAINELKSDKVDKVAGKGLSTNDFDNTYKQKIDTDIPAQLADKANKVQEPYISPSLINGATQFGTIDLVQYKKDQFGEVKLRGMVVPGTLPAFMSFPAGYRPKASRTIRIPVQTSAGIGRITIFAYNGNVEYAGPASTWVSLDNVRFDAEA